MRRLAVFCLAIVLSATCGCSASKWKPRLIILLSLDTCRADHLSCYGYPLPTSPNIDRLAKEGIRFANAFSQSNESLFSYSSVLSGLYPERIGRLNYDDFLLTSKTPTLPSIMHAYGYHCGGFVAGGNLNHAFGFAHGFDVFRDRWNFGSLYHTLPEAMRWLDNQPRGEPAFLFLQGYDAHTPYAKPLFFNDLFDPDYRGIGHLVAVRRGAADNVFASEYFSQYNMWTWLRRNPRRMVMFGTSVFDALPERVHHVPTTHLNTADVHHMVAHYDGAIAYADILVGLLIARLHEMHVENETLLILMGDHGEDLMEHGFFNHRSNVYDASLHVPLIVWAPGALPRGKVVTDVVQLIDILPTVLDYANIATPTGCDGASLRPLIAGVNTTKGHAGFAFSEGILKMTTVRTPDARLIYDGESSDSLPPLDDTHYRYAVIKDGKEVSASPKDPLAERLRDALMQWRNRLYGDVNKPRENH